MRENSIRLRLLQTEVNRLLETGEITEKIQFSEQRIFAYSLKISNSAAEISAAFDDAEITIEIPASAARDWIETAQTGLESEQKIKDKKPLRILIEKDFVCSDRQLDADNADAFPNPSAKC